MAKQPEPIDRTLIVYANDSTLVAALEVADGLPMNTREKTPPNIGVYRAMEAWEIYRAGMLAALVIAVQSAMIVALFLQYRRRVRREGEFNLERLELSQLSRTSQFGELSGALAHELTQPLTAILSNAEVAFQLLDKEPLDIVELREVIGDIIVDNKRATNVITQLPRLMIRGDTNLEPMDLNHAVTTTLALARSELQARQTHVDVLLHMPNVPVHANLTQLQQVILNLVLNACDAMAPLAPSAREIFIRTRKCTNRNCELTVEDRGPGIPAKQLADVFRPFVSTKASGLGLGLAICKSIARAHGGTLRFDNTFTKGARAVLSLPSV